MTLGKNKFLKQQNQCFTSVVDVRSVEGQQKCKINQLLDQSEKHHSSEHDRYLLNDFL